MTETLVVIFTLLHYTSRPDCTQCPSFLFVIERLERARCETARETGVSKVDGRVENGEEGRCCARSSLSITVDEKKGLRPVYLSPYTWYTRVITETRVHPGAATLIRRP